MANWSKERWQEIANRGLQDRLSPERKARFDEIVRRGLITIPQSYSDSVDPDVPTAENLALSRQAKEPAKERGILDRAIGAGEAALTAVTGATGGLIGGAIGNIEGALQYALGNETEEEAQQRAANLASQLTYQPRTEAGQEYVGEIAEVASALPPVVAGFTPQQLAGVGQSVKATAQAARGVKTPSVAALKPSKSIGAAETPQELIRAKRSESLPVPVKLTKGQKAQDMEQQRFERETAKTELGEDIRNRYAEQNAAINQNIDAFIDETGTQLPDFQSAGKTGELVDKALRARAARDKSEIRAAYKAVENSDEAKSIVDISPVAQYMNENMAGSSAAPIMQSFQKEAKRLGIASGDIDSGDFTINEMTLKQSEDLRKFINRFANETNPNDVRVAAEIKSLIDDSTKDAGGQLYQKARRLRSRYAQNYENIGIVRDLLGRKRGTQDRKIALENVANKIVNSGSVEDLKQVRRVLRTEGETGNAAFTEIQAQILKDLRDAATSNTAMGPDGKPLISAAKIDKFVKRLDQDGKLDILYGKQGAQAIRDLRDTAIDVYVSQPGAVNYSNTSSAIAAYLDLMASPLTFGATGLPLPIVTAITKGSKAIKDRAIKKRVEKSLQ